MAEYIERENLLEAIDKLPNVADYCFYEDDVVDMARAIPAADVAPVVRGRWDLLDDASSKIVKWNCNKCNRISTRKTDYCPNCGARMEG